MPHNRGTRHKPDWCGAVSYKGKRKWVGGCRSVQEYNSAAEQARAELCARVDSSEHPALTVGMFAGAVTHESGRITMTWPDGQRAQKDTGRKEKTIARMREGLKPFLREFWDRPLDSFSRDEALTWALAQGSHVRQSVRQFFNHALDRGLIPCNHFARTGASKKRRRVDRHDFEIIGDDLYARLRTCARASRVDGYGPVLEGIILAEGETAMRPSEIFALHRDEVDFTENGIDIAWQIDSTTGKRVPPKDGDARWTVMSPAFREHVERMPVYSAKILFPAVRGGYYTLANFYPHWHAVRAAAGIPGFEFYELKHRALQWMVDPVEEGGLGLDHQTAARMAGHDDGGWLIFNVYTKLSERRARERAQRAVRVYQHRAKQAAR